MQMVTEEKFSLLFKTHFTIGGELEATLNVSSLSPFSSSLFPPLLPICLPKFLYRVFSIGILPLSPSGPLPAGGGDCSCHSAASS